MARKKADPLLGDVSGGKLHPYSGGLTRLGRKQKDFKAGSRDWNMHNDYYKDQGTVDATLGKRKAYDVSTGPRLTAPKTGKATKVTTSQVRHDRFGVPVQDYSRLKFFKPGD